MQFGHKKQQLLAIIQPLFDEMSFQMKNCQLKQNTKKLEHV